MRATGVRKLVRCSIVVFTTTAALAVRAAPARADAVGECRTAIRSACVLPNDLAQRLQRACDALRQLDETAVAFERNGQRQQAEWIRAQIESVMRTLRDAIQRACAARQPAGTTP